MPRPPRPDPFTLEIIKDALVAIGDEMFVALQRTSKSPIIYEVLDYACGLTDAAGQMLAQGQGVTGFLGTLGQAVAEVRNKFAGQLHPGDIIVTNDPYGGGGTHPSDVSLVLPVFFRGHLAAFMVNKAHWTEVGGKDPGSWTTDATEVYQEGLVFPCIKLFDRGRPLSSVVDMLAANVRLPDMTLGDLWAGVAALRVGERRFVELCEKFGLPVVQQAIGHLLDHGERLTRRELRQLPKGVFAAEDTIDDDGVGNGPFPVRVVVTITDDEFICDFTGTHPQVPGPINATRTGLFSSIRTIFKAVTGPHIPVNEGCFRPVRVICPPRTIFTAERPAPVSTYWETKAYAIDLVWKALAPALPDRLTAGHFLSVCGTVISGLHPDTGDLFILVEPQAGGWGAGAHKDGESGLVCCGDGETYVIPVEVTETRHGVMVDQFAFNVDDGGAGQFRGGRGLIRDYRITAEEAQLTATFGRFKFPPWSVGGGRPGSPNFIRVLHRDGREVVFGKCARYRLTRGDVARLVTGSGGGWGAPARRDPARTERDLREGMVPPTQARDVYRVSGAPAVEQPVGRGEEF
ncbi:MAG TPA: hydantoinase B/oxoprolinase family protein [bacterium]|nr:hydantoinase B/oxoprolinase family protein [bacterium]